VENQCANAEESDIATTANVSMVARKHDHYGATAAATPPLARKPLPNQRARNHTKSAQMRLSPRMSLKKPAHTARDIHSPCWDPDMVATPAHAAAASVYRGVATANGDDTIGPTWMKNYNPPGHGVLALLAIDDIVVSGDRSRITDGYDSYYDAVPSESEVQCMRSVPSAEQVRSAWRHLAACITSDSEARRVLLVDGGFCDMLIELLQLGATAQRLGVCYEYDLNRVAVAARACPRILFGITCLAFNGDIESVLHLLGSSDMLRAVLTMRDRIGVLEAILCFAKNVLMELSLPIRTASPDEHAAHSEAMLASSLVLIGAVATTPSRTLLILA
jgi:hypothetical protein